MEPLVLDFWVMAQLAGVGLFAGLVGGLIGVGGSIVIIPAVTELLGERQHLYQASAMIVNFCVALPAFSQHVRAGAVMGPVVRRMAPLAVAGVVAGVAVSELPAFKGSGQAYLMVLFGLLVLMAAVRHGQQLFGRRGGAEEGDGFDAARDRWKAGLLAGVPTGFVGGLLGVGGGVVAVPLQTRLLRIPLRQAIANSATTIVALSLVGAIGKNYAIDAMHNDCTLRQSLTLAAALAPTAIVGSLVGSRLTHVLPLRIVRGALVIFLSAAAIRMMAKGILLVG